MKQNLKSQSGIAFIVVILVIVLAVCAGLGTFLGVRMAIAGGHFLQPFADLGWISLDDEEDKEENKDDKSKDKKSDEEDEKSSSKDSSDKTSDDEEDKASNKDSKDSDKKSDNTSSQKSRLSDEAKKADAVHYYGSMTMADSDEYKDDEFADLYKLLKLEVDLYARENKVVEIVFTVKMKDFLKEAFNTNKDEFATMGYTNYEDFEKEMLPMFESMFDFGFESATEDSEFSKYLTKYQDGGDIQLYVTKDGFDALYDTYGIKEGENDVDTIIESLEEAMELSIKKV